MIGYASSQYSPMALQFCEWLDINRVRQHFLVLLNYDKRFWITGVKTVCESPTCFRDGLLEILRLDFVHDFSSARASSAESSFQSANPSQLEKENVIFRSEPWRRVSLALFCFHALLLERNRYTNLGFSGVVEFTYYDLKSALILIKVLYRMFLSFYILLLMTPIYFYRMLCFQPKISHWPHCGHWSSTVFIALS
jgi:hypothetical protein